MAKKYSGRHNTRLVINALKGRELTIADICRVTRLNDSTVRRIVSLLHEEEVVNRKVENLKNIRYYLTDEVNKRTIPSTPNGVNTYLRLFAHLPHEHILYKPLGNIFRIAKMKYVNSSTPVGPEIRMAKNELRAFINRQREDILILEAVLDDDLLWNETAMETWPSDPHWAQYEKDIPA